MLTPDTIENIYFYKIEENGWELPTNSKQFSSVFVIDENKHVCQLILNSISSISPGEFKNNVPIKFLCPDLVLPKLLIGAKFYLWDMRNIGEGVVEKIIHDVK